MNDLVKAFENRKTSKNKFKIQRKISKDSSVKIDVPKGLYEKCPRCKEYYDAEFFALARADNTKICSDCGTEEALNEYSESLKNGN